MTPQTLTFTQHVGEALDAAIGRLAPSSIFVLADSHTATLVVPELHSQALREATLITIEAGDAHKDLAALTHVWQALQTGGATRKSLMVNVGGGVVTDLGGLAAATFKRGINYINTLNRHFEPLVIFALQRLAELIESSIAFDTFSDCFAAIPTVFLRNSQYLLQMAYFHFLVVAKEINYLSAVLQGKLKSLVIAVSERDIIGGFPHRAKLC